MKIASFEQREWIDPWRDRRPMTTDPVLVSIVENGKIEVAVGKYNSEPLDCGTHIVDIGWFVDGFHLREFVLAWMPLPDPYNPVEEEELLEDARKAAMDAVAEFLDSKDAEEVE